MFELHDIWKAGAGKAGGRKNWTLKGANVSFDSARRIALLGAQKEENTAVLRILAGVEEPDRGAVRRIGVPCWPFDHGAFLELAATLHQNARFLGHVYGVDGDQVARIAAELADVKAVRGKPLKAYAVLERKALQLGLTLSIQFDWYFVDERLPNVAPERVAKVDAAILDRLDRASVIWATTKPETLDGFCDAGLVLDRGALTFYNDYGEASDAFRRSTEIRSPKSDDGKPRAQDRKRGAARRAREVDPEKPG